MQIAFPKLQLNLRWHRRENPEEEEFNVGMEPTLTGLRRGDDFVGGFERDTSLHLEAYYYHPLNRNIAISPGIIWITAPNQDADNADIVVGALRTVFSF